MHCFHSFEGSSGCKGCRKNQHYRYLVKQSVIILMMISLTLEFLHNKRFNVMYWKGLVKAVSWSFNTGTLRRSFLSRFEMHKHKTRLRIANFPYISSKYTRDSSEWCLYLATYKKNTRYARVLRVVTLKTPDSTSRNDWLYSWLYGVLVATIWHVYSFWVHVLALGVSRVFVLSLVCHLFPALVD